MDELADTIEATEKVASPDTAPGEPTEQAEFEETVARCKRFATAVGSNKWNLGAEAHQMIRSKVRRGEVRAIGRAHRRSVRDAEALSQRLPCVEGY